jgi:hypothetical protein
MTANPVLRENAQAAANAAKSLANSARQTTEAKRLTLGDHFDVLIALAGALEQLAGDRGVIHYILPLIDDKTGRYLLRPGNGQYTETATALRDGTAHAHIQAQRANLSPAVRRVRDDAHALAELRSTHGERAPRRNKIARHARDTTDLIVSFGGSIGPVHGPITDVAVALAGARDIAEHLQDACVREAKLLEGAYLAAGLRRGQSIVYEVVDSAGKALGLAHATLVTAADTADGLNGLERRLLAA